jgi:hypothetical protein
MAGFVQPLIFLGVNIWAIVFLEVVLLIFRVLYGVGSSEIFQSYCNRQIESCVHHVFNNKNFLAVKQT